MAKGRSGGHNMQLRGIRWTKKERADWLKRRQRRAAKIQQATPRIIQMSIDGRTLTEISKAVDIEPFVVDAILRKEAQ